MRRADSRPAIDPVQPYKFGHTPTVVVYDCLVAR